MAMLCRLVGDWGRQVTFRATPTEWNSTCVDGRATRSRIGPRRIGIARAAIIGGPMFFAIACVPKVEVALPSEPIVINMNIKIEHEVRVRVDEDLEAMLREEDEETN